MLRKSLDLWILGFRISDDTKRKQFAQWIDDNDGALIIRGAVARIETSHNHPDELWSRMRRFFDSKDRCVMHYLDKNGDLAEAIFDEVSS